MIPQFLADLPGTGWDPTKTWLVPVVAGCVPLLLWLLTRRTSRADAMRANATAVEQLYIGSAEKLLATLQEELRTRNARLGALEAEREQLRSALGEERQMFDKVRQRHRDLITLVDSAGITVPVDLHV